MRLLHRPGDKGDALASAEYLDARLGLASLRRCPRDGIEIDDPLQASHRFTDLLLPRGIARKRVEGGAPYMYEHGEPQCAPDKDDSEQTYPRGKRLAAVASSLAAGFPRRSDA